MLPRQGINPDVTTKAGGIMGGQVNHIAERAPRRPSDATVATAQLRARHSDQELDRGHLGPANARPRTPRGTERARGLSSDSGLAKAGS